MDTFRPMGHTYEEEPHRAGIHSAVDADEGEGYHEKKPVIKKVKEKVKKIKDTIKKKHHHGGDRNHRDDDIDDQSLEEQEEEEGGYEDDDDKICTDTAAGNNNTRLADQVFTGHDGEKRTVDEIPLREFVGTFPQDPAAPNDSKLPREGKEIGMSPVIEAFEAIGVSQQPVSGGEVNKGRDEIKSVQELEDAKGDSYTGKLYTTAKAAAETAYEKGSTAVKKTMAGEGIGMGSGVRAYLAGKLRPGEDDKALSEMISSAIHERAPRTALRMPAIRSQNENGGEVGFMGKIKGAVASLIGSQQQSFPGAADECHMKGTEDVIKKPEATEETLVGE